MSQHGHFMSQMTDPLGTDVATFRSVASDLCQVSKVLQDSDIALLVRLCEITKAQMQEQVAGVISSGSGGAILQMSFADGTPAKTTVQYRRKSENDSGVIGSVVGSCSAKIGTAKHSLRQHSVERATKKCDR